MSGNVRTTGIGSVPFTSIEAALAHVFRQYDIPFYPQLPQRRARFGDATPLMMREVLPRAETGPALMTQLGGQPDLSGFWGWDRFLAAVPQAALVKMQLTGPCTLAAWLAGQNPQLPTPALKDLCWEWIEKLSAMISGALPAGSWLVWDDALLAVGGDDQDVARFHALKDRLPSRLGLHCCAPGSSRTIIERFSGAVVALDFNVIDVIDGQGAATALSTHWQAGGELICGIFDTRLAEIDLSKGLNLARRLRPLIDKHHFIVSGGCGTGLRPKTYEKRLAAGLKMIRSFA